MNEQPENLKFDYVSDLLKFDYMNPDFKTKNNNGSMYFLNTPEQKFFFAHKIIDCLNKINESNNSFFNFETVTVDDTALRGHECFTVNLKMPVGTGTIYFNYNANSQFVGADVVFQKNVYLNKTRFPDFFQMFRLSIQFNKDMQIEDYKLIRGLERDDEYYLDISYIFDKDNIKLKDVLTIAVYNMKGSFNEDILKVKKSHVVNTDDFDNFFNKIIDTVILSPNTFLEITPQFTVKKLNNSENFEIFYDELRAIYEKGLFVNIDNDLEVVRMAAI